jgi:hypothetical protein
MPVLAFGLQIANAVSAAVSTLVPRVGGRFTIFGGVAWHSDSPLIAVLAVLGLLGVFAAIFDSLVRRGWLRAWAPPFVFVGAAIAAFTALMGEHEPTTAAALAPAVGLGSMVGLTFGAWWVAARATATLRASQRRKEQHAR